MRPIRCFVVLLLAAASAFAAPQAPARSTAGGRSLLAAVRAVALQDPGRVVPAGASAAELLSLPPESPIWTAVSNEIMDSSDFELWGMANSPGDPGQLVHDALRKIQSGAEKKLHAAELSRADAAGLAEMAPLLSPALRVKLDAALREHGVQARKTLAAAEDAAETLTGREAQDIVFQAATQKTKIVYRNLDAYDALFGQGMSASVSAKAHNATLRPLLVHSSPIRAMVDDARARRERPVWAEIGGGYAMAQREWAAKGLGADVRRVNVDLLDWENMPLSPDQRRSKERNSALLAPEHRPDLILADAKSVRFPDQARPDLITSAHSVQYWWDKIQVFAHLYNELADGGVLAIVAQDFWAQNLLRSAARVPFPGKPLLPRLAADLASAGVQVLIADKTPMFQTKDFATPFLVRKKAGTRLESRARLESVVPLESGYLASYYRRQDGPLLEVVSETRR